MALVAYELRRREPLLEPRFFRSPPFAGATMIAVCGVRRARRASCSSTPSTCRTCAGYSPLQAGLCTLPMAVMAGLLAPAVGPHRRQPRRAPAAARRRASACWSRALLLTRSHGHHPARPAAGRLRALRHRASASLNPPITNTAVSGMPNSQAGVAAAVASTSRQVGQTLGVAVIGSILGTAAGRRRRRRPRVREPPRVVGDRRLRRGGARARRGLDRSAGAGRGAAGRRVARRRGATGLSWLAWRPAAPAGSSP